MNAHDPDTTEQSYLEVIYRKTAKLFEAGAQMAAIVSGLRRARWSRPWVDYGRHLGNAFQLVDDALDYTASSEQLARTSATTWRRQADPAGDLHARARPGRPGRENCGRRLSMAGSRNWPKSPG